MGYLKGKSSLLIFDRHANLKYKYGDRHFWARGYFVDTVGRNKEKIREYIRKQLTEDKIADRMSMKEFIDPFKGSKIPRHIPCPHFQITITQRSKGQSAVAGAAYQSGEKLFSEYDQKTKNYSGKRGILYTEIMLPSHAPPEYANREKLWNSVEAAEKQWNAQLDWRAGPGRKRTAERGGSIYRPWSTPR